VVAPAGQVGQVVDWSEIARSVVPGLTVGLVIAVITVVFGTRHAADVQKEVAQINADSAQILAREKDRREWRRVLIQPVLDEAERRRRLFVELGWAIEQDVLGPDAEAPPGIRKPSQVVADLRQRENIFVASSFRLASSAELAKAYAAYENADQALLSRLSQTIDEGAPVLMSIVGNTPEELAGALAQLHLAVEHHIYGEEAPTSHLRPLKPWWRFW